MLEHALYDSFINTNAHLHIQMPSNISYGVYFRKALS